jgi:hypothetical protein
MNDAAPVDVPFVVTTAERLANVMDEVETVELLCAISEAVPPVAEVKRAAVIPAKVHVQPVNVVD